MNAKNWKRSRTQNARDAIWCDVAGHDWTTEPEPFTQKFYCRRRCLAYSQPGLGVVSRPRNPWALLEQAEEPWPTKL